MASFNYKLTHRDLLELKRFNTPTIANALELCGVRRPPTQGFNREETRDFMSHMGPMIGYAVTAEYRASRRAPRGKNLVPDLMRACERSPKPCLIVIRDLDSPGKIVGAPWGECFANMFRALGAVGTITDGAIRDYHEMNNVGLHAIARRLCVSHAHGHLVSVGQPVTVFGTRIRPGELIHADQHGFITIPVAGSQRIAAAARHMDRCEMEHVIGPARMPGYSAAKFVKCLSAFNADISRFKGAGKGEW